MIKTNKKCMKLSRRKFMTYGAVATGMLLTASSPIDVFAKKKGGHVIGFQHVGINVLDMDKTIKFYEDNLGFKLVYRAQVMEGDKPQKMAFMVLNGFYIELLQSVDTSKVLSASEVPNYFSVEVDSVSQLYDKLSKRDIDIETMPKVVSYVSKKDEELFFIKGLNGERIVIYGKGDSERWGDSKVSIYCNSHDASVAYYKNVLGFEHIMDEKVSIDGLVHNVALVTNRSCSLKLISPDDEFKDRDKIKAVAMRTNNHFCLRVDNMVAMENKLKVSNAYIEAGPFDAYIPFDRVVKDKNIFAKHSGKGVNVKILFVRGINGERIEIMQDNIG